MSCMFFLVTNKYGTCWGKELVSLGLVRTLREFTLHSIETGCERVALEDCWSAYDSKGNVFKALCDREQLYTTQYNGIL